jgi:hypothetical protein
MVYLRNPADGLARVQALSPEKLSLAILVEQELAARTSAALAELVAKAADPSRPWAGVELEGGEAIGHLPIAGEQAEALATALAALPAAGAFGAVKLPPPAGAEAGGWLAWNRQVDGHDWLTIATSERALVTGEALEASYGEQPVSAALDISRLQIPGEAPPVERLWARGKLHDLEVKVRFREDFDPSAELPLVAGAMGELLTDASTLVGASSRYRDHEKAVGKLISEIQDQISDLPFLIKGFASDLAARFNSIARSWNGRFALAMAEGHVRLAYGADDATKAGVAVLHFLRGAADGISMARNFSSDIPDLSLKKNATRSGEIAIHRLTIRKLKGAPKELRPLLDDRRNLNVAFAFDAHIGGGLLSVGPDAVGNLKSWVAGVDGKVTPTDEAAEGAVHLALSLAQIAKLAEAADAEVDLSQIWDWKAEGPPYDLEIRKLDPRHWSAHVRGPIKVRQAAVLGLQPVAAPTPDPKAKTKTESQPASRPNE